MSDYTPEQIAAAIAACEARVAYSENHGRKMECEKLMLTATNAADFSTLKAERGECEARSGPLCMASYEADRAYEKARVKS